MPDAATHVGLCASRAPQVVVTGVGLTTGLGVDAESTWRAVVAGRVGMAAISEIESALPPGSLGGQALALPLDFCPDLPREARYLRWTVEGALRAARLDSSRYYHPSRCGAMLGTTLHGIRACGRFLRTDNPRELRAFLAGATARLALSDLGIEGGVTTTCSACSSSLGSIALAITLLQSGAADIVIAGGYDVVSEYAWGGFNALRLISPGPVRPFCKGRQGMKIAEGYGIVVLERAADAAQRGAPVVANIAGWGESADAHHLTQPAPDGEGAVRAMSRALQRGGLSHRDIGMIAAHATGTHDNDAAEYHALARCFQVHLAHIPVVGFKSVLGHTLGGAGAVELILSMFALRDQIVPACANVSPADIEFPALNVCTGTPRAHRMTSTLNTSLGFGGANTCVVLTRDVEPGHAHEEVQRPAIQAWITGIGILLPSDNSTKIDDAVLANLLNVRRARRLSPYVKFTLAAALLAVRDAAFADAARSLESANAILGSMHGSPSFCLDYYSQIVREGVLAANPVLFAEGVPNAAAAHLSTTLGIKGSCQTIIGSRTAGLDALVLAAHRVRAGEADIVLVVAAEEAHESLDRAYRDLAFPTRPRKHRRAVSPVERPDSFRSVDGAIAFIVESHTSAVARAAAPYASIGDAASASVGRSGFCGAVSSVLRQVHASDHVRRTPSGTWLDRAEQLGVRRARLEASDDSLPDSRGELFSVAPCLAIAQALMSSVLPRKPFTSLCTDWTGNATAVNIEPAEAQRVT